MPAGFGHAQLVLGGTRREEQVRPVVGVGRFVEGTPQQGHRGVRGAAPERELRRLAQCIVRGGCTIAGSKAHHGRLALIERP
jgi:hypothetical protein